MTNKVTALNYAFAVGRVRALENYLIPYQVFREAAEAETAGRALELISDAGKFGEDLLLVRTPDQLDRVLLKERMALDFNLEELFLERKLYHAYLAGEHPAEMVRHLAQVENLFIQNYFRLRLDLANLKLFWRCRYLELPVSRLEENFLPGGSLEKKIFLENYESSNEEFYQLLRSNHYGDLWKAASEFLASRESLVALEREIENLSLAYLRQAKQITFGPEPLFAYGLARRHELKLVRIVLAGKFLQLPVSFLKERISQTYV
ncbi:MAG: V-type ATPase subunit [Candidatus Saccharicenans sp.]|uniref:V-type ATPase subunit n=1 Tax=Candidatus Saccharicenans sp. TaxID=2819258 RepID=UPI00404B892B